jgi:hypothetical protein
MAAEKIKPYHWWKHTNCQRHTMPARRFEIKYGKNIGYGIYCKLLEIILFLEGSLKKKDVILYCEEFGMSEKELLDVLDYGLSCEVFYENGEAYHCEFIDEVYAHGVAISEVKSDAGKTKPQANEAANDVAKDIAKPTKPNKPDHTQQIVDHWNALARRCKCEKVTSDVIKAIGKRLKEYSLQEVLDTIQNYHSVLNDSNSKFTYAWNIIQFMNQANAFPSFYGNITDLLVKYGCAISNPEPEQPPAVWSYPFAKPAEWDSWSVDERRACLKERMEK